MLEDSYSNKETIYMKMYITVEPCYSEGPGDWQNIFFITRFFLTFIEVLFHIAPGLNFTITGVKKNSSLDRGLRYRGSTVIYIII